MAPLMAVPNVSEGRRGEVIEALREALAAGPARPGLLDVHSDPDHHRTVLTLAGEPGTVAPTLRSLAREVVRRVDLRTPRGAHPHVGALDVAPVAYLRSEDRGAACAEALLSAQLLGEDPGLPVLLYGMLAGGRTRASLRRGGAPELARRLRAGELAADFGPAEAHPSTGVTLVGARPPLVAFNVELAPPAGLGEARAIAARLREGGAQGLPGVRALGLEMPARAGRAQVSFNVEDPLTVPLAVVLAAVRDHATVHAAELVGLAPRGALEGFPADVPLPGFDPAQHLIENRLGF